MSQENGDREAVGVPYGMLLSILWVLAALFLGARFLERHVTHPVWMGVAVLWGVPLIPTITTLLQGQYPWRLPRFAWLYILYFFELTSNLLALLVFAPILLWLLIGVMGGLVSAVMLIGVAIMAIEWFGVPLDIAVTPGEMLPYALGVWGLTLLVVLSYGWIQVAMDRLTDLVHDGREAGLRWINQHLVES